jgi:hypothetical protein
LEEVGEDWWTTAVDEGIRKKAEGRMTKKRKSVGTPQEEMLQLITLK